jgi:3-mercaptopyruvate sulfurtransferase SseA
MKKSIFIIAGLMLATFACQTLAPQTETVAEISRPQLSVPLTEADVSRIDVHEAKAAIASGQAILVDVRSAESYTKGHAAGAVSIPLENFEKNIGKLSLEKSQWIITYCT